jgi:hypothetical protein
MRVKTVGTAWLRRMRSMLRCCDARIVAKDGVPSARCDGQRCIVL